VESLRRAPGLEEDALEETLESACAKGGHMYSKGDRDHSQTPDVIGYHYPMTSPEDGR